MASCSTLLIVTDSAGIEHVLATDSWRPLALRADQRDAAQLLFVNSDTHQVEALAAMEPPAVRDPERPEAGLYLTTLTEVDELLDPPCLGVGVFQVLGLDKLQPHHEAVSLADADVLWDVEAGQLQAIEALRRSLEVERLRNSRDPHCRGALAWLRSAAGAADLARRAELVATPVGDPAHRLGPCPERLPDSWCAVVPAPRRLAMLSTLRSFWAAAAVAALGLAASPTPVAQQCAVPCRELAVERVA